MLDPQLYQSRVASEEEISPVPAHDDPGQTDDPDPTDPSEKLGKIVRSERFQTNQAKSVEHMPGTTTRLKGQRDKRGHKTRPQLAMAQES